MPCGFDWDDGHDVMRNKATLDMSGDSDWDDGQVVRRNKATVDIQGDTD